MFSISTLKRYVHGRISDRFIDNSTQLTFSTDNSTNNQSFKHRGNNNIAMKFVLTYIYSLDIDYGSILRNMSIQKAND